MTPDRPRCRCCKHPLTDELSRLREVGPCCWEGRLSAEERAEIEAGLPSRPARPRRLRIRRAPGVPGHRDDVPEDDQPSLFDPVEPPESGAA